MATSIRLSPELGQRLDRLARATGRTKAYYLREILESGIAEMEQYYMAAAVVERVRKGEEATFSAAEVKAEIGLEG
jgi:RHH-type transcriptional regulator, rel operon repressor / antitoxin RelB